MNIVMNFFGSLIPHCSAWVWNDDYFSMILLNLYQSLTKILSVTILNKKLVDAELHFVVFVQLLNFCLFEEQQERK